MAFCPNCGTKLRDGVRFCPSCGKEIIIQKEQAETKAEPAVTETKPAETKKEPVKKKADSKKEKADNGNGKKTNVFTVIWEEFKNLLKNPKKLIPSIILAVIWTVLPMVLGLANGSNIPIMRFFSTLTFANGGMFGGFFGILGGTLAKIVFAAVVNVFVISLFEKKNPFKGLKDGFKGIFAGGLSGIAPIMIGGGAGLLLYWFFNITSAPQNIAISVAGVVAAIMALSKRNGFLFFVLFKILGLFTKGKAPKQITISRIIMGFASGFAVAFPLTFTRRSWITLVTAFTIAGLGVLFLFLGKNAKKTVATAALIFICAAALIPFLTVDIFADYTDSDNQYIQYNYVPYRGYLTYTHPSYNKYGQPFPDLMDFNGDGYINMLDLQIQKDLSHNPDLLNQHAGPVIGIVSVATGAATAAIGAAGAAVIASDGSIFDTGDYSREESFEKYFPDETEGTGDGEETPGEEPTPPEEQDLGPYISKNSDGDIVVRDPVNGKEIVYTNNGDGTYTNGYTDSTYTPDEIKEIVDYRDRNSETIRMDEDASNKFNEEQRAKSGELSWIGKEHHDEIEAQKQQDILDNEKRAYIEELKIEKGLEGHDDTALKKELIKEKTNAGVEFENQMAKDAVYEQGQKYAENVEKVSDATMNAAAEFGGEEAKLVRDAYVMTKETLKGGMTAYTEGRSVVAGTLQGVNTGVINTLQNNAEGVAAKAVTNIGGEIYKEAVNAKVQGKDVGQGAWTGAKKGTANFLIDITVGKVTKKLGINDVTKSLTSDYMKNKAGDAIDG